MTKNLCDLGGGRVLPGIELCFAVQKKKANREGAKDAKAFKSAVWQYSAALRR